MKMPPVSAAVEGKELPKEEWRSLFWLLSLPWPTVAQPGKKNPLGKKKHENIGGFYSQVPGGLLGFWDQEPPVVGCC